MSDAAEAIGGDEGLPMQVKNFFTPKVAGPIAHKALYAAFVLVGLIFFFSGLSDAFGSATKPTVSVETTYVAERVLPAIFFCAPKHMLGVKWYGDALYGKPLGQAWWGRACGDPDEGDPENGRLRKRDMLLPPCDDSGVGDGAQFDITGLGPDAMAMGTVLDGALGGGSMQDLFNGSAGAEACADRCEDGCQLEGGGTDTDRAECKDCAVCQDEEAQKSMAALNDMPCPEGQDCSGGGGGQCDADCKGKLPEGADCTMNDAANVLCADCATCQQAAMGGRRLADYLDNGWVEHIDPDTDRPFYIELKDGRETGPSGWDAPECLGDDDGGPSCVITEAEYRDQEDLIEASQPMIQIESDMQTFCKAGDEKEGGFAMWYNGMAPKATTGTCVKASRTSPTVEKVEKYFGKTMMCWVLNEDGKIKSSSSSPSQLKFALTGKKKIGDFLAYGIVGFYDKDAGAFNDAGNLIAKYYQIGLQNVVNMFGLSVDFHEDQTDIQSWSGAPAKGSGVRTADWRGSVTTMTARHNAEEYFESAQVFYIDDFTTRTSYTRGASVSEICNALGGAFALAMCIIGLAFRDEMAKVGDGPKYPVRVFRFQDRKSSKMEAEMFLKNFLGKAANAIAGGALNGDMDVEAAGSAVKSSAIKAGKVDQAQAAVATGAMIVPTA